MGGALGVSDGDVEEGDVLGDRVGRTVTERLGDGEGDGVGDGLALAVAVGSGVGESVGVVPLVGVTPGASVREGRDEPVPAGGEEVAPGGPVSVARAPASPTPPPHATTRSTIAISPSRRRFVPVVMERSWIERRLEKFTAPAGPRHVPQARAGP